MGGLQLAMTSSNRVWESRLLYPAPSPPCPLLSSWARPVATSISEDLALGDLALGSGSLPTSCLFVLQSLQSHGAKECHAPGNVPRSEWPNVSTEGARPVSHQHLAAQALPRNWKPQQVPLSRCFATKKPGSGPFLALRVCDFIFSSL